jgi:hypothetical protein
MFKRWFGGVMIAGAVAFAGNVQAAVYQFDMTGTEFLGTRCC